MFIPSPAGFLGGFVTTELARACVVPKAYTPNPTQPPTGHNPMTLEERLTLFGRKIVTDQEGKSVVIPAPNAPSGRDVPQEKNDKTFWLVRMVSISSEGKGDYGAFYSNYNTIVINTVDIATAISDWNARYPQHNSNIQDYTSFIVLHELCHVLIDDREGNLVVFDTNGNNPRYLQQDANGDIVTGDPVSDLSKIGVRDHYVRETANTQEKYVDEMKSNIPFARLVKQDIKDIQEKAQARG